MFKDLSRSKKRSYPGRLWHIPMYKQELNWTGRRGCRALRSVARYLDDGGNDGDGSDGGEGGDGGDVVIVVMW